MKNIISGCPNYQITAFVFFIFRSVGEGEVWFEGDYLINALQTNGQFYFFWVPSMKNIILNILKIRR
jgi:hypothetical protein